jgi:hypothetical protein
MAVDEYFIQELIVREDPLAAIWQQMWGIYGADDYTPDLRGFMDNREEQLNGLERTVYDGFFEAYDQLLEAAQTQDAGYVLSLFDRCPLVVIADSLSVREAALLEGRWAGGEWEAQMEGFAVVPFPPSTESLCRLLLGTPSPALGRSKPEFEYRYVAGPEHIPHMPSAGPLLVWMRLPDTALEGVTLAQTHTVAEAFELTIETLERVLTAAGREEALLTSDHGYLYARSPAHYWRMPLKVEEVARSIFPRASRFQKAGHERARGLRNHESPHREQRFFAFTRTHVAMRGRYWWGTASPNERCTAHGGLSFVECLVPILRLSRRTSG